MNFHLNEQLDEVLVRFYETYSLTNGTADYVPETSMKLIDRQIDRAMRTAFKTVEKENKAFQKALRREERKILRKERWAKFCAWFRREKGKAEQPVFEDTSSAEAELQPQEEDTSSLTPPTPSA